MWYAEGSVGECGWKGAVSFTGRRWGRPWRWIMTLDFPLGTDLRCSFLASGPPREPLGPWDERKSIDKTAVRDFPYAREPWFDDIATIWPPSWQPGRRHGNQDKHGNQWASRSSAFFMRKPMQVRWITWGIPQFELARIVTLSARTTLLAPLLADQRTINVPLVKPRTLFQ